MPPPIKRDDLDGLCGVYGLADPRFCDDVVYIGQARDVQRRIKVHCDMNRYQPNLALRRWLRGLRAEGLSPKVVILARCDPMSLSRLEASLIRAYRANGMAHLNCITMRTIFIRRVQAR
jgi:hypothetical protein